MTRTSTDDARTRLRLRQLALGLLLVLAAGLRLTALDRVPPALHPDEAANAADALDLLQAPALCFRHEQGGWVEGTYVFAAALPLQAARAGWLSLEAAARLPAALAGLALVAATWPLARRLGGPRLALAATALIAVQPWAVHTSRLALRGALIAPLVVSGLALAAVSARRCLAGGLLLALAAASYPPARLVVPLLALAWWRWGRLPARGGPALALPPCAVLLLLLPWTLTGGGSERLRDVLIPLEAPLPAVGGLVRGAALHYSTRFLFSGATSRGFAPEGVGLLTWSEAPLLVLGLVAAARRRGRRDLLLLSWALLFPLGAAPTRDVPNALRAALGSPLLALLGAAGWRRLRGPRRGPRWRAALAACVALTVSAVAARAARDYRVVHPREQARFWFAGRRELVEACRRSVSRGQGLLLSGPFVTAYLRLYGRDLPRTPERGEWRLGPAPARFRVRPLLPGDPLSPGEQAWADGAGAATPLERR